MQEDISSMADKNDFTVAFVGCLRKKEVAFEDALRIIYLIDPSDKVNHERVKYIYKHKGRLAGISNLKHLLEGQGLSNTEVVAAITGLFAPIDVLHRDKNCPNDSIENVINSPDTVSIISVPIRTDFGIGNMRSVTRLELHSDSLKQVTDKTKMDETGQRVIISRSIVEVTSRPPILRRIIKVEDTELLEVSYGKDNFYGNVKEIEENIRRTGGIASTELFKSSLSSIIEHQRNNASKEVAYPCLGVFVDSVSKRFVVAHPKLINNVLNLKRHSDNEASKVVEQVLAKVLPDNLDQIRTLIACYVRLPAFFPKPIESVLPLCYGILMPFVYELKNEFSDYFCQVLLYGPKGTGKTSVCNSITEDLYGIEHKSLEHISSQYRYLQVVNATTLPEHIAEVATFDFDKYADIVKSGTDSRLLGTRYNADQSDNRFFGKSSLVYSANSYKASDTTLPSQTIANSNE